MRPVVVLLLGAIALAQGSRTLRYAESADRLVYAFVFGHKDTCRVIRRPQAPRVEGVDYLRRFWDASYRGEPGDTVVAEFAFGRYGRPIHFLPTADARWLVAFANREAGADVPRQDRIHPLFEGGEVMPLDYRGLPREAVPQWPAQARLLKAKPRKKLPPPPPALNYGFAARETSPGRVLVARQSEGEGDLVAEMVCFVVDVASGRVALPEKGEVELLLDRKEPLFRAGGAWAAGQLGDGALVAPLKGALSHTTLGAARAEIGRALVRCGEPAGRNTLRALLRAEDDVSGRRAAALALAQAPDRADAEALAGAIADPDADTARFAGLALVRLGTPGLRALVNASRSSRVDVREAAAALLARVDDIEAERRVLALGRDGNLDVQSAAAKALTSPPRRIYEENHADFGRTLDACRVKRNEKAARRLAILAGHARIAHDKVLKALVDLAPSEPKAIWALKRITGAKLDTAADWRNWWRAR